MKLLEYSVSLLLLAVTVWVSAQTVVLVRDEFFYQPHFGGHRGHHHAEVSP